MFDFKYPTHLGAPSKRFKSQQGFTLIEILVAVGIFAVITSIVAPAMFQFLEIRERVNTKHQQLENLQKTFLFLANDLRYATNRLGKDEFGEAVSSTLLVNDDNLLDLTASYPDLNLGGLGVPRRVSWRIEDGVLQRIQSPVMDPDGDTRKLKQSLIHNVRDIKIELSAIEEGRDETSDKWEEQTRLPDKISITVELENRVEYQRVFTMLGGNTLDAVAASINSSATGAPN